MTVGVLGGGQLGRMLALAGISLGLRFRFLDRTPEAVAGEIGALFVEDPADPRVLDRFLDGLTVATYEFENVPVDLAERIERKTPLFPSSAALAASQDRLVEKNLFRRLGIETTEFAEVSDTEQLTSALRQVGLPAILKTRRLGYDGRGQALLRDPADAEPAWQAFGRAPCILERFIAFSRELSLVAVRDRDGAIRHYPLVQNEHRQGVLYQTIAPAAGVSAQLESGAQSHIRAIMESLGYIGVLAVEFFEHEGRLIANEMAPRVHNSGHWSIDAAATSQFENHLRAILGWPLGDTSPRGHALMRNIVGRHANPADILAHPAARLHDYGKPARRGRKLGHVTLVGDDPATLARQAAGMAIPFEV